MKRIVIYVLLLAAALLAPAEKADVAQLRPVEVVCVLRMEDTVLLQTDTDDLGQGPDAARALEDLKRTSPAWIYLDTADFLLIGEGAEQDAEALRRVLKPAVQVCYVQDAPPMEEVSKYLRVHGDLPKFSQWETGAELPVLTVENERLKLLKKSEIEA